MMYRLVRVLMMVMIRRLMMVVIRGLMIVVIKSDNEYRSLDDSDYEED